MSNFLTKLNVKFALKFSKNSEYYPRFSGKADDSSSTGPGFDSQVPKLFFREYIIKIYVYKYCSRPMLHDIQSSQTLIMQLHYDAKPFHSHKSNYNYVHMIIQCMTPKASEINSSYSVIS